MPPPKKTAIVAKPLRPRHSAHPIGGQLLQAELAPGQIIRRFVLDHDLRRKEIGFDDVHPLFECT